MPLPQWFQSVLVNDDFQFRNQVRMYSWEGTDPPSIKTSLDTAIRNMKSEDLPAIHNIDTVAFDPIWQNTLDTLTQAYKKALFPTVAQIDNRVVGYQISTISPIGGHLARLAVKPDFQGKGIGKAILQDLLHRFSRRGTRTITVNTQADNAPSISLYTNAGFHPTGEEYPIMEYTID